MIELLIKYGANVVDPCTPSTLKGFGRTPLFLLHREAKTRPSELFEAAITLLQKHGAKLTEEEKTALARVEVDDYYY